jgi:asparagine synthase (glutamine-hydrolysing)
MTGIIMHRGPDNAGFHIEPEHALHLGFRRLAIIDIAGDHQPMWNEDSSVCVVFNSEIGAARRAARRRAPCAYGPLGHRGSGARLRGMGRGTACAAQRHVTFVICDRPRRRLLAARDRFGFLQGHA